MFSSIFAQPRPRAALAIAAAFVMASLLFVSISAIPAAAVQLIVTQDTAAQFNLGTFYHTGLTASTVNGGDSNGQVRLLNIGINASTWNLGTGTTSGLPSTGLYSHAAALIARGSTDYIYVTGGFTGTKATNTTCYTSIASTHQLNNWTCPTGAKMPDTRQKHASVAMSGYLYVIGGLGSDIHAKATVYRSALGSSGLPGTWVTSAVSLPVTAGDVGLYELRAVTLNGRVYVLGGANDAGAATSYVFIGTPGAGGELSWVTSPTTLPAPLFDEMVTTSNGRIYVVGGVSTSGTVADAYWAQPAADGSISAWTHSANGLQNGLAFGSAVAFADQLYISGGSINQGGTPQQTVKSDLIDDTGDYLPGWLDNNVLSQSRVNTASVVSTDGWIYVIEGATGTNGTVPLSTIDYGPTSVASGTASYAPNGTYVSPPLYYSGTVGSGTITVQKLHLYTSIPTTTTMTIAWRTSNDPTFPGASFGSETAIGSGTNIQTDIPINQPNKYVQYRVTMNSDTGKSASPVLNRVDAYFDIPPTMTPTSTNTPTRTMTNTPTKTGQVTGTKTKTPTITRTRTKTLTPTITRTRTKTPTPTKPVGSGTPTKTPTKTPPPVLVQDSSYLIGYGGFKGIKNLSASGGTYYFSRTAGDKALFAFKGTSITWLTLKSGMGGIAKVYIDNVLKKTVDLYQATGVTFKYPVSVTGLPYGAHVITVLVTGTKNARSAGANVVIDAFKMGTYLYQDTSWRVQYNQWKGTQNSAASGLTYRQNNARAGTNLTHETVTFNFSGTSVTWLRAVGPTYGQVQVYIDGVNKGVIDSYYPTLVYQQKKVFSGLAAGAHTIVIQVLGTKQAASGGTRVVLDGFIGIPR